MAHLINFRSPAHIRKIMAELEFMPSKTMGQNFLIDGNTADLIIRTATADAPDHFIEVGGGLGTLTDRLIRFELPVHSIEKDDQLFTHLKNTFGDCPHLVLLHQDALDVDVMNLSSVQRTAFVSNLPYSVGSRILMNIFMQPRRPLSITVTIQRDVAERICAPSNCRQFSLLTLWAQMFYNVDIVKHIAASCFHPAPKVESTLVHGTLKSEAPAWGPDMLRWADHLTHMAFQQRRKQIVNTLRRILPAGSSPEETLLQSGIAAADRPEHIDIRHWISLIEASAPAQLR